MNYKMSVEIEVKFCRICLNILPTDEVCSSCSEFFKGIANSQGWRRLECTHNGAREMHSRISECDDCRYRFLRRIWNPFTVKEIPLSLDESFSYFGSNGISLNALTLSDYEQHFIDKVLNSYRQTKEELRARENPAVCIDPHARITQIVNGAIYHMINFIKLIPDFGWLCVEDRRSLLKQNIIGMYLLSIKSNFDFSSRLYAYRGIHVNIEEFRLLWKATAYTSIVEFLKNSRKYLMDETMICLTVLVFLFDWHSRCSLQQNTRIRRMHFAFLVLLQKYLVNKFGVERGRIVYAWIKAKLTDLFALKPVHDYILIDRQQLSNFIN